MKKQDHSIFLRLALVISIACMSTQAFAYELIVRPYESVRTSGMGGVFETTGLYDQNFFGNPARVCANPTWRFTIFDVMAETDTSAISHVSSISGSGNTVQKIAETAGSDNHLRLQTTMPAWYLPPSMSRKWGMAIALITSTQVDFGLRNNYEVDDQAYVDVGPALTYGHTFLEDDSLAVGVTGHLGYRMNTSSPITIQGLLNGQSFSPRVTGGEGTMIDADIGVTKRLSDFHPWKLDFDLAFAVDNVANGKFSGTLIHPLNAPNQATNMYRAFGGGVAVHRESLGIFSDTVVALEASDIGTRNQNGSFYRTLHLGGETHLTHLLIGRLGLNQGYFAAGVGLDLKLITIDASTYGEELGLNAGDMQDRRYAVRVALQL
jgi:hypothetical protein